MARLFPGIAFLSVILLVGGCAVDGSKDDNLRVRLTDAPALMLRAVNVTIAMVRVHQSASAGDGAAGWVDIPVIAAMPVDLMKLQGGVLMDLCGANLEAGDYQQVRLVLTPNEGGDPPYRNSVMDMDGVTHPMDVPGNGTKISHGFSVAAGTTTDLILDFDAANSCKMSGNGTYSMAPWITATSSTN